MAVTHRDIARIFHSWYPLTMITPDAVDYVYHVLKRVEPGLPYYQIREGAMYTPTTVALEAIAKRILDAAYLESNGYVVGVAEVARALDQPSLALLVPRKGTM
jgi:hypothetical protein